MVSQAVLIPHTMMDGKHTNMAAVLTYVRYNSS